MSKKRPNNNRNRKSAKVARPKKAVRPSRTKPAGRSAKRPVGVKTVIKTKVEAKGAKELVVKRGVINNVSSPEEIKEALSMILNDANSAAFLRKNVSKWAPDVLNMLTTPKTDEYLAEKLNMKINAIRRILNLMQGYGVTNYYVAKNTNGWLSFAWYVNVSKVGPFFDYIKSVSNRRTVVTNECNDYFLCNECYPKDKLVFTFDAAYEAAFRCNCGQKFVQVNKDAALELAAEEQRKADMPTVGIELGNPA